VTSRPPPAPVVRYGEHPDQVANLHLPASGEPPFPCVVLLHGGFWRERWDRTLMTPLALDLAGRGVAVWNVEYRRVGQEGGGWPGTLEDVAAAAAALGSVTEIDSTRIGAAGHSAGGHLALWLAAGDLGLDGVVSLAGVCDLRRGFDDALGGGAVADLLGGSPEEVPDRYAQASPAERLPLGAPQLLVHGGRDEIVPPGQSRAYAEAARSLGDDVTVVELSDADHFDVIEREGEPWTIARTWLLERLAGARGS
jgi:acetyl esterase/lipase